MTAFGSVSPGPVGHLPVEGGGFNHERTRRFEIVLSPPVACPMERKGSNFDSIQLKTEFIENASQPEDT